MYHASAQGVDERMINYTIIIIINVYINNQTVQSQAPRI